MSGQPSSRQVEQRWSDSRTKLHRFEPERHSGGIISPIRRLCVHMDRLGQRCVVSVDLGAVGGRIQDFVRPAPLEC